MLRGILTIWGGFTYHPIKNNPKRPYITFMSIRLILNYLRGHVQDATYSSTHLSKFCC